MKLYIRPALGIKVRDPKSLKHIPDAGCEVEDSVFWQRRIQSGCVVIVEDIPSEKKPETLLEKKVETKKETALKIEESKR